MMYMLYHLLFYCLSIWRTNYSKINSVQNKACYYKPDVTRKEFRKTKFGIWKVSKKHFQNLTKVINNNKIIINKSNGKYFYNQIKSNLQQQTTCLVVNPITVGNFAFLFNCTPVGRTSDSMMVPT